MKNQTKGARKDKQMKGIAWQKTGTRLAFSMREVGELFGLSRDSIKRYVKNGDLQAIKVGGRVLILASEVQRIERGDFGKESR
jgi:excisionase family DNA binding protein